MRYEHPKKKHVEEIKSALSKQDLLHEEITDLVLSAIYYADTKQAVDILIDQFNLSKGEHKSYLMVLFNTIYDMHRTDYRINESIGILNDYKTSNPDLSGKIQFVIDNVLWAKQLFIRDKANGASRLP